MVAIVSVYDQGIIRAIQGDGGPWTRKVAGEVMNLAIAICPSRSGHLASCHGIDQNRSRGSFSVGFNVYNDAKSENGGPLALWVHNGTGIYGPRGMPILPVNTPMRKYMHIPPHMLANPWIWYHLSRGIRKFADGRVSEPDHDPWAHTEEVDGERGNPWLRRAGEQIARDHGAY